MPHCCLICKTEYSTKTNLNRHLTNPAHLKLCVEVEALPKTNGTFHDLELKVEMLEGKVVALIKQVSEQAAALASLSEVNKSLTLESSQMRLKHAHEVEMASMKSQHAIELMRLKTANEIEDATQSPMRSIKKTIKAKHEEPESEEDEEPKEVKNIKKTPSAKLLQDSIKKISGFNDKKFFYKKGGYYDKSRGEACSTCKFIKSTFDYVGDHFDEIKNMEAKDKTQLEQHVILTIKRKIEHFHHIMDPLDMKSSGDLMNLLVECDSDCGYYMFDEALKMHKEKQMEMVDNFATPDTSK
jgi:hypothetical protein